MIRFAVPGDRGEIRRLWDACFSDEGGFNDYFFTHLFEQKHTLVYEQDGALCAMLQMLPYRMQCGGQTVPVTYIYGACTDPAHRRKGLMAKLLEDSFALDREAGRAASVLIPQEEWLFGFYQAFGYAPAFFVDMQKAQRQDMDGILPRRLTEADIPQLDAVYRRAAGEHFLLRDTACWSAQLRLFDTLGKGAYGWFESGMLTAYAFCWEKEAQEAVGLSDAQAQGLLRALDIPEIGRVAPGGSLPLGCAKWYEPGQEGVRAYMNLMLN